MKTTQTLLLAATFSAGLLSATVTHAALIGSLNGQTVYDADLNITWLANANLAATNTFGLAYDTDLGNDGSYIFGDGSMTWSGAQKWVAAMNTANYLGYNDWRLPSTTDTYSPGADWSNNGTDTGYNSRGSEMSHLYYNEFNNRGFYNTSGATQFGYGLLDNPNNPNDESLFINLQSNAYWSGTVYAQYTYDAWYFNLGNGLQYADYNYSNMFALVVRDGQVATVPVPAAAWLLGSGLLGLIGVARRKAV